MRGEYTPRAGFAFNNPELPPRARRILLSSDLRSSPAGTTSACAENTHEGREGSLRRGNYLRVRGEYSNTALKVSGKTELPPRARRIRAFHWFHLHKHGTTSACAENTPMGRSHKPDGGNYLRVRGEYPTTLCRRRGRKELPPRARRIRTPRGCLGRRRGTTSACAENTSRRGG